MASILSTYWVELLGPTRRTQQRRWRLYICIAFDHDHALELAKRIDPHIKAGHPADRDVSILLQPNSWGQPAPRRGPRAYRRAEGEERDFVRRDMQRLGVLVPMEDR